MVFGFVKSRRTQRDEALEDNVGAMWTSQHAPVPTFLNLLGAKRVNHAHPWQLSCAWID